jgi:hypothetical protein
MSPLKLLHPSYRLVAKNNGISTLSDRIVSEIVEMYQLSCRSLQCHWIRGISNLNAARCAGINVDLVVTLDQLVYGSIS